MTPDALKAISADEAERLSPLLRALWCDAQGDWEKAHSLAQDVEGKDGARVHAYLHRKEGDGTNARYWYRQAGVEAFQGALDEEWTTLIKEFS